MIALSLDFIFIIFAAISQNLKKFNTYSIPTYKYNSEIFLKNSNKKSKIEPLPTIQKLQHDSSIALINSVNFIFEY